VSEQPLIWLATGGTGGHVFPAEALAEVLLSRGYRVTFLVDSRTANIKDRFPHVTTHVLPSASPTRKGIFKKLDGLWKLKIGTLKALQLIGKEKPKAVVSFGGYASIPAAIASVLSSTPLILHEQNAVLGRAHRFILCKAARVALSFPRTLHADMHACNRMTHTGNPVRAGIRTVRDLPYPTPRADGPLTILITGGSLGATIFADQIPLALAQLPERLRARLEVIQQCREEDLPRVREAYRNAEINAVLAPFFTDMPQRLALAHIVIARSGASTVSELITVGRPSILVPLPIAADDHQTANANYLVDANAAWIVPQPSFTAQHLAHKLTEILSAPELLEETAMNARALGKPDAADLLADVVAEFAWPVHS
jgi:UDP-N-acetylglucosamine--N-acetylmuramyl-(pentapeptide) pyrophosphoryl-undecaprenol N-acetylglucosamine transferase